MPKLLCPPPIPLNGRDHRPRSRPVLPILTTGISLLIAVVQVGTLWEMRDVAGEIRQERRERTVRDTEEMRQRELIGAALKRQMANEAQLLLLQERNKRAAEAVAKRLEGTANQ